MSRNPHDADAFGPTFGPIDSVERALATALEAAAAAGRFDVVAQLARELEARHLAAAGNVVPLSPKVRRNTLSRDPDNLTLCKRSTLP
jgi:hypothetical protein